MRYDLEELEKVALDIARDAGRHTLQHFEKGVEIRHKKDKSPVTVADREAEQIMRDAIREDYPDHGIIGEEYSDVNPDSEIKWILDPIDGTLSFIHGVPLYTTLIGILIEEDPLVGVIYAPVTEELCHASKGNGAYLNGDLIEVSGCTSLNQATFLTTDPKNIRSRSYEEAYQTILEEVDLHRTWGDAYGHMMVASGRADIMFDPVLHIWDSAPLLPILVEANGRFTDTRGKADIESEFGFISCSAGLHHTLLDIFTGYDSNS